MKFLVKNKIVFPGNRFALNDADIDDLRADVENLRAEVNGLRADFAKLIDRVEKAFPATTAAPVIDLVSASPSPATTRVTSRRTTSSPPASPSRGVPNVELGKNEAKVEDEETMQRRTTRKRSRQAAWSQH